MPSLSFQREKTAGNDFVKPRRRRTVERWEAWLFQFATWGRGQTIGEPIGKWGNHRKTMGK